ncbi:hypothetical protein HD597_012877 [Nonomuraea thailandensis]|uniref:Uncharacterized protein n=1 Tax=Nonomuraea thailandensis TaxID=1188745 RepID=A0A9X2H4F5_9ACTN|nr:hypothetical protein [Nonomuraea thailandensis]MCP2365773.1 hypothetical protein [Nonomuraea thailandensis]
MAEPAFHEDDEAHRRLEELGLSWSDIEHALLAADREARLYTHLDPPNTPGIGRWGKTNRFLRERLTMRGWTYDNPRNLPRTIHPEGEFAIVATTGDECTGLRLPGMQPTTRYAKGPATAHLVERNERFVQPALFEEEVPGEEIGEALAEVTGPTGGEPHVVWLLLYNAMPAEIRSELSLPLSITSKGYVDSWSERILLPALAGKDLGEEA